MCCCAYIGDRGNLITKPAPSCDNIIIRHDKRVAARMYVMADGNLITKPPPPRGQGGIHVLLTPEVFLGVLNVRRQLLCRRQHFDLSTL